MATIANQIKRISDARDLIRSKGTALGLQVPAGNYWDDATDTYKAYNAAALTSSDQIDKIAAAFNSIVPKLGAEIKVPITVTTDGTTTTVESYKLDTGFYANATIVPYIKVNNVDDIVINVEMLSGVQLNKQSDTIKPSTGFNYIGQFGYTIVDGAISTTNDGYDNTSVVAKVATSGWLDAGDTQRISVDSSKIQIGSGTPSSTTSTEVTPATNSDTVITISKGIFGSNRTITIKSLSSEIKGDAVAEDILFGKTAYVNGVPVTGTMPNKGGDTTEVYTAAAASPSVYNGTLAIKPQLGYYNDKSTITTTVPYRTVSNRVFDTKTITVDGTDTMTSQTYYETIPAGYYSSDIKRKITVTKGEGAVSVDYTNHKAIFTISKAGWFDGEVKELSINAGPATYAVSEEDLKVTGHAFVISPEMDQDNERNSYLTQVTIDNTAIFNLLAKI